MRSLSRPFLSTFVNRIDAKGRVSVPAKFRDILETQGARTIYARTSTVEPMIEAGGPEWMAHTYAQIEEHDPTSELYDDYAMSLLGDTVELTVDSEGRVVLPEGLLRHAALDEAAAFVGVGSHFRIWEPKALEMRMVKARRSAAEHRGQLRLKNGGGAHD